MLESSINDIITSPILQVPTKVLLKPAGVIRALHPSFSEEDRYQLLKMQYRDVTYQDAMVSGNAYIGANGKIYLRTKRTEASFKGMVFEAFLARMCRDYVDSIGRQVFSWSTNRRAGRVQDSLLNQYTAFVTADKSLLDTTATAWLYNTAGPFDLQFYRINDQGNTEIATLLDSATTAGVQIKAITGNERTEIIEPMLQSRYRHVLTLLKHQNGQHSFDVCMTILAGMQKNEEITGDQYHNVVTRLARPDQLGIDQYDVDQYSHYLSALYRNHAIWDQNVYEAITLEVTSNLAASQGGILIPASADLIIPDHFLH